MAISEKTIIDFDDAKPGVPIRKGVLAGVGGVFLLVAAVAAIVMDYRQEAAPSKQLKAAQVSKDMAKITGSPAVIEEENRLADKARESERNKAVSPNPVIVPSLPGNPNGNDAALLGRTAAAAKSNAASNREEADLAMDTTARISPVVKFDESILPKPGSAGSGFAGSTQQSDSSDQNPSADEAGGANGYVPPSVAARAAAARAMGNRLSNSAAIAPQSSLTGNRQWLNEYAQASTGRSNESLKSYVNPSKFTLHQGKVIPAILGRKLNSDLPGEVTAYVSQDVYDSLGNAALLIPKGSTLVGSYNSDVRAGQDRMLFAFQRLIMPNGRSFDLPAAQASDLTGASGLDGNVNNHFFKMFATSFLIAWSANQVTQPNNVTVNGGTAPTNPAGQILVDIGRNVLQRNTSIPPTITIDQGTRINVQVAKDMEFPGPYKRSVN